MATTSRLGTFKMRLPEVIRTINTLSVPNTTPKNERLPRLVDPGNTYWLNSRLQATQRYSIVVLTSVVTSVNTAPNPLTVAERGVVVPPAPGGIKERFSVMVLSKAVKSFCSLNAVKSAG